MPRKNRKTPRPRLQRVSIRAEHRTEVDWDRFAWAVLQHARVVQEREKEDAEKRASEGSTDA